MKKIITMLFVCMSSLGYGAEFQDTEVYDFDTDLPLPVLTGEDQPLNEAVLAVPAVVVPEPAAVERSMDIQPGQTICGVCDKHFRSHAALIIHNRTHTGEKPYVCSHQGCASRFAQAGSLERHMRTHAEEKPYVCSYEGCASRFPLSHNLKEHVRTHTGERPYVCSHKDCGSRFTLSHHLKDHMMTHTGKKPYACSHEGCGKAFNLSQHLIRHMRTHTGERPYACPHKDCEKAFALSHNLKQHMRTHTGEKPFGCKECGKSSSSNSYLKAHMRRVHEQADKPSSGSLSLEQVSDNNLEEDEESDNADKSEHEPKRMRFNLPAPGQAPAPLFIDVFEDLPLDQMDAAHSYICAIQGCFECFSTIQDRTNHEMRVHAQTLGFRVLEQDGNGDMMMPLDGLGSVGFQQPVAVPAPGVFGSLSPEQAVDQDL